MESCNHKSFKRKDHLNRHLIQHQGKMFECTLNNCNRMFPTKANLTRHMKQVVHDTKKIHTCSEPGCGKVCKYPSKLHKHQDSHIKLQTVEALCGECNKYFTNNQCLKDHIQSSHQHINCEICGNKHLKKNIKRHLQSHKKAAAVIENRIECTFDGCHKTCSNKSNLAAHVKACHHQEKPFVCSFSGCGERFAYKHVRDKHEMCGRHVYIMGDFVEADEEFRSRERRAGGVKRKLPGVVDDLMRRRVLPSQGMHGSDYLSWLLSASDED